MGYGQHFSGINGVVKYHLIPSFENFERTIVSHVDQNYSIKVFKTIEHQLVMYIYLTKVSLHNKVSQYFEFAALLGAILNILHVLLMFF